MCKIQKNKIFLAMLGLASLGLAGCADTLNPDVTSIDPKTGQVQTRTDAKDIQAGLLQAFPDVPLPAKHHIDLDHSLVFNSPHQTVGKLVTEGDGDVNSLYRFYEKQMPAGGWSLVNSFLSSTASLYFAKPGKFVAIIIESTGRGSSRVSLSVGPE